MDEMLREKETIFNEMLQKKAEILLRALTEEMERNACWLELLKMDFDRSKWHDVTTFNALEQKNGDVDSAKRQLAKWWSPRYHPRMDMRDVHRILQPMFLLRRKGNMAVHPFFAELHSEQLLKLAKLANGDDRRDQWQLLIGWRQMREDIKQNEKSRAFVESCELENLSKLHLDRLEIKPKDLHDFEKEMESRTQPRRT